MKTTLTAGLLALATVAFAGHSFAAGEGGCLGSYSSAKSSTLQTAQDGTATPTTATR